MQPKLSYAEMASAVQSKQSRPKFQQVVQESQQPVTNERFGEVRSSFSTSTVDSRFGENQQNTQFQNRKPFNRNAQHVDPQAEKKPIFVPVLISSSDHHMHSTRQFPEIFPDNKVSGRVFIEKKIEVTLMIETAPDKLTGSEVTFMEKYYLPEILTIEKLRTIDLTDKKFKFSFGGIEYNYHLLFCFPRKQTFSAREYIAENFKRAYDNYKVHSDVQKYKDEITSFIDDPEMICTSKNVFLLIEYYICLYQTDAFLKNQALMDVLECRIRFDDEQNKYYKISELIRGKFPYHQKRETDMDEPVRMVEYRKILYSEESQNNTLKIIFDIEQKINRANDCGLFQEMKRYCLSYQSCFDELTTFISNGGILDSTCQTWYSDLLIDLNVDQWLQVWFTLHNCQMIDMTYKIINPFLKENGKKELGMIEKKNALEKNLESIILGISTKIPFTTNKTKANEITQWVIRNLSYHPIAHDPKHYPFALKLKEIIDNSQSEDEKSIAQSMFDTMLSSSRIVESSSGNKKTVFDIQMKLLPSSESPFPSQLILDFYTQNMIYVMGFEQTHAYMFEKFSGDYKRSICQLFEEKSDLQNIVKNYLYHNYQKSRKSNDSDFFSRVIVEMKKRKTFLEQELGEKMRVLSNCKKEISYLKNLDSVENGNCSSDFFTTVCNIKALKGYSKKESIANEKRERQDTIDYEIFATSEIQNELKFIDSIMQKMTKIMSPMFLDHAKNILNGCSSIQQNVFEQFSKGLMSCVSELCNNPEIEQNFDQTIIVEWKKMKNKIRKNDVTTVKYLSSEFNLLCSKYIEDAMNVDSDEIDLIKNKIIKIFINDVAKTLSLYEGEIDEEYQNELVEELYMGLLMFVRSDLKKLSEAYLIAKENVEENQDMLFTIETNLRGYSKSKKHLFDVLKDSGKIIPVEKIEQYLAKVRDGEIQEF
jgi:hypothetical protein